jgi:hypothetical protein
MIAIKVDDARVVKVRAKVVMCFDFSKGSRARGTDPLILISAPLTHLQIALMLHQDTIKTKH